MGKDGEAADTPVARADHAERTAATPRVGPTMDTKWAIEQKERGGGTAEGDTVAPCVRQGSAPGRTAAAAARPRRPSPGASARWPDDGGVQSEGWRGGAWWRAWCAAARCAARRGARHGVVRWGHVSEAARASADTATTLKSRLRSTTLPSTAPPSHTHHTTCALARGRVAAAPVCRPTPQTLWPAAHCRQAGQQATGSPSQSRAQAHTPRSAGRGQVNSPPWPVASRGGASTTAGPDSGRFWPPPCGSPWSMLHGEPH